MQKKNKSLWKLVEVVIKLAKYQTWDGCHKIYLIMDEETGSKFNDYDYQLEEPNIELLHRWFENSCGLRFIDAVTSVREGQDPNKGYVTLIKQGN